MPSKPKLSSKTPDAPEYNTLITRHDALIGWPRERYYAVVELKVSDITTDIDTGEEQARIQIVHIEQPVVAADAKALESLLDSMFQKRTKLKVRSDPHAEEDTPLEGIGLDTAAGDE